MKIVGVILTILFFTFSLSSASEAFLKNAKQKIDEGSFVSKGLLKKKGFFNLHVKIFDRKQYARLLVTEFKKQKKGVSEVEIRENVFIKILEINGLLDYRIVIERIYSQMLFEFGKLEQEQALIFFVKYSGKCSASMKMKLNQLINDNNLDLSFFAKIIDLGKKISCELQIKDIKPIMNYFIKMPMVAKKRDVPNMLYLILNSHENEKVVLQFIKEIKNKCKLKDNTMLLYGISKDLNNCIIKFKDDSDVLNKLLIIYLELMNRNNYTSKHKNLISWEVVGLFLKHLEGKNLRVFQKECVDVLKTKKDLYIRSLMFFMLCKIDDHSVLKLAMEDYKKAVVDSGSWRKLMDFFDLNNHIEIIPILKAQLEKIDCSKKALCQSMGIAEDAYDKNFKKTKAYALMAKIIIFNSKKKIKGKKYFTALHEGKLQSLKETLLKL